MPLATPPDVRNRLIADLPRKDRSEFLKRCQPVELVFGEILCEAGRPMTHIYFPLQGFISRIAVLEEQQPLEIGLVGNEGMMGETLALGVNAAPMRAVVQGAGTALRMSAAALRRELRRRGSLAAIVNRYLYVLIAQLTRLSACTRFHEIEPRLARWLLMTHDRAHTDQFRLTHEFLAAMLGVRRSGVTIAAGNLQAKKLVRYHRGELTVLDRRGLEAVSCSCYAALRNDYSDVFD